MSRSGHCAAPSPAAPPARNGPGRRPRPRSRAVWVFHDPLTEIRARATAPEHRQPHGQRSVGAVGAARHADSDGVAGDLVRAAALALDDHGLVPDAHDLPRPVHDAGRHQAAAPPDGVANVGEPPVVLTTSRSSSAAFRSRGASAGDRDIISRDARSRPGAPGPLPGLRRLRHGLGPRRPGTELESTADRFALPPSLGLLLVKRMARRFRPASRQ